jgi:hypothetical protein
MSQTSKYYFSSSILLGIYNNNYRADVKAHSNFKTFVCKESAVCIPMSLKKQEPEVDVENLFMEWRKLWLTSSAILVNKLTVMTSENGILGHGRK